MDTTLSQPRLGHHTMSVRVLEALTLGRGDAHSIAMLKSGELSVRLALLWELFATVSAYRDHHSPLAHFKELWSLLSRAFRRSPDSTSEVLLHPYAGVATVCTIRRIKNITSSENPLWTDLAYFHALTTVAAVKAGLEFQLTLASHNGVVVLPTLGYAFFPHSSGWKPATVRHADGVIRLSCGGLTLDLSGGNGDAVEVGGVTWYPARRLQVVGNGESLDVILDDIDQFRDLRGATPPAPMDPNIAGRWRRCFDDAWTLLVKAHHERASAIAAGLVCITPSLPAQPFRPLSASSDFAFGAAVVSEPEDAVQLAVGLVHEFQHNKLGALMHQVEMYRDVPGGLIYAPWRDDPRPLRGVIQGVYAFVAVTEFWCAQREYSQGIQAQLARFEFVLWHRQTLRTLETLSSRPELTDEGARLVGDLLSVMDKMAVSASPDEWELEAQLAAEDHYARWCTHHQVPDRSVVHELADAWSRGQACPVLGTVGYELRDDPDGRWLDSRAVLYRMWLTRRDAFDQLQWSPEGTCDTIGGARYADALLVKGNVDEAESRYLDALTASPLDAWAWTGLRLVRAKRAQGGDMLDRRPEIVVALQRELHRGGRPATAMDLVSWCGDQVPPPHPQ